MHGGKKLSKIHPLGTAFRRKELLKFLSFCLFQGSMKFERGSGIFALGAFFVGFGKILLGHGFPCMFK